MEPITFATLSGICIDIMGWFTLVMIAVTIACATYEWLRDRINPKGA